MEQVPIDPTAEPRMSEEDRQIIDEEARLLSSALESIRDAMLREVGDDGRNLAALKRLRDDTVNARPGDLPGLLNELQRAQAVEARERPGELPDPDSPYFAHMRIEEDGQSRDFFLGKTTFLDTARKIKVIDWRNAPLSRIFYNYREGDDYVEQLPGRVAEGTVEVRRVVTIHGGELVRIVTPDRTMWRDTNGVWRADERGRGAMLAGGEGIAARGRGASLGTGASNAMLPDVTALLDETQFSALSEGGHGPMLILGSAGSGKTTVALHRLSTLVYSDPERFRQDRMCVMVPERGLALLVRQLLDGLKLEEVRVEIVGEWMREMAERFLRGLPKQIYPDTPPGVSRLKRHPALLALLPEFVEERIDGLVERLRDVLPADAKGVDRLGRSDRTVDAILGDAKQIAARSLAHADAKTKSRMQKALDKERDRMLRPLAALRELLTDRDFLARVVELAGGELEESAIERTVRHTMAQAGESADVRYADVDEDRLKTLDGESIDYGTPDEPSGTRDSEDDALLLEVLRLSSGAIGSGGKRLPKYDHLVLDEAQDLAPVEMSVFGQTLGIDPSVTVAGDPAQQIRVGPTFTSWETILDHLNIGVAARFTLEVNYRSTRQIAEFAHRILGPLAPAELPRSPRDGVEVGRYVFPAEGPSFVFLAEALTDLLDREPGASVAVICRNGESADATAKLLAGIPRIRRVRDGDFPFTSGVDVVDVGQVKGLEFDYVIVPDANADAYPNMPDSRRLLHVAATRAVHQLWVVSVGHPSPIVPA